MSKPRTTKTNPTPPQPNGQPQNPKKAAAECLTQHLNGYIYELRRNGASPDFITRVQSEANWAVNELAEKQIPS